MTSLFSKPKVVTQTVVQEQPAPETPPPTRDQTERQAAEARRRILRRGGRQSTLLSARSRIGQGSRAQTGGAAATPPAANPGAGAGQTSPHAAGASSRYSSLLATIPPAYQAAYYGSALGSLSQEQLQALLAGQRY